jgi:lipoyl(octanoyl) transferase
VEELAWRLLPYAVADGPTNMATDEALLRAAVAGVATLHFYGWSLPTLSLGYFQKESVRHSDPLLAALPFVRRPTGGETLVHHHELTYALTVPAGARPQPWPQIMHEVIAAALASLGIEAHLLERSWASRVEGPLCFHHATPGDVLVATAKVVGSAQRKHRGAVLQHGSILLASSPYAPTLPGVLELTGKKLTAQDVRVAVIEGFEETLGTRLVPGELDAERMDIEFLKATKYLTATWNCKP